MLSYTVEFIDDAVSLHAMLDRISAATASALDIETINWWDREAERVSLIQFAFREENDVRVAIIDALAGFDIEPLRRPLELSLKTKAIHNASYDAVRLARHFHIATSPIHDTMLAARRSGDRRCSLQAQVEAHLGFHLDKSEQRGDWRRRPLSKEQLNYASLDAACTLLLYEKQIERGLRGDYELRERIEKKQVELPLSDLSPGSEENFVATDLDSTAFALLGVVVELSGRYSPEQLSASVGAERVGLAGWIIDLVMGVDADIDENSAKQEIATLRERGLIQLSPSRRLEATSAGADLWRQKKF